ncbi:GNAT family N-acetyltransferase [Alkalilimnicola ehrlichii]|uniref:GNAT family N-acetyltransferase n=1 Tax=Alkalilimnicola ehrlichii TaxID=351052 RepID=UPI003B9F58FD
MHEVDDWIIRPTSVGEGGHGLAPVGKMLEHDTQWLFMTRHPVHGEVWVAESNRGVLPVYVHNGAVRFLLGGVSLGHVSVRRHVVHGNLPEVTAAECARILAALRGQINPKGVVFLIGVVKGEPLWEALSSKSVASRFYCLQSGSTDRRRLIRLGQGYDAYLASLPKRKRKDLRRSERRFDEAFGDRWCLATYETPEELRRFIELVEPVSERTYQHRLLGLGIKRGGWIERQVMAGAQLGYSRCYALFVGDELVSWRVGFCFNGVYYSHHVGYDPEWSECRPGIVMHLKVIRDICERTKDLQEIDLLHGDNPAKAKLSNAWRDEAKFYLFPKTARGCCLFVALGVFNYISDCISRMAEKLRIKEGLRRRLRRAA